MAEMNKQLVLVVEGSPTMGLNWQNILYEYLHKIIRSFCGNDDTVAANDNVELGLVVFNANESSIYDMSQRYGLTREMNVLLFDWLAFLNFGNGGYNATIADGLNAALMLFDSTNVSQNRHCILVAENNSNMLAYEETLFDAETVAKSFSEFGISLSVICPEDYRIFKDIYIADCADLSQSGIITVLENPVTTRDPVNWNWNSVSVGNNPPETVQAVGPSSQTSAYIPFGSTQESVLHNLSHRGQLQTPAGISGTGEISVGGYSNVSGSSSMFMSQPLYVYSDTRMSIPETGTMMPRPPLITPEQVLSQPSYVKLWEEDVFCPKYGHPVFVDRLEGPSTQTSAYFPSGFTNTNTLNQLSSQVRSKIPSGVGSSMDEYSYAFGSSSIMLSKSFHEKIESQLRVPEPGSMMLPLPYMSYEQVQSESSRGKVWEGNLCRLKEGRPVFIARLEAYQMSPFLKSIARDWPTTMILERLISQDFINNTELIVNADTLVFRSTNHLIRPLQETKKCAFIRLPMEVLVLVADSYQPNHLTGMLFPHDRVVLYH